MNRTTPTVSAEWLMNHLGENEIQVVDATWYIPSSGKIGREIAQEGRSPGAIHVDIDFLAAERPGPPGRMFPDADEFQSRAKESGLNPRAHIVIYDNPGLYSAARLWFVLWNFGHQRVSVLNGGLPAWKAAGGLVEQGPLPREEKHEWERREPKDCTKSWQDVLENIDLKEWRLLDVRPPEMFNGDTSNLYAGVRPGHIPGSQNFSQRQLSIGGKLLSPDEIVEKLAAAGIGRDTPVVATCGSGVTACILSLAMAHAGLEPCSIYDGSWEEWGMRSDLPTELESS